MISSYMKAFLCNTAAQALFLYFHCFFSLRYLPESKKNASVTNIISGRPRTRTRIWGNNELVDNGTSLHMLYYIFNNLHMSIAGATI